MYDAPQQSGSRTPNVHWKKLSCRKRFSWSVAWWFSCAPPRSSTSECCQPPTQPTNQSIIARSVETEMHGRGGHRAEHTAGASWKRASSRARLLACSCIGTVYVCSPIENTGPATDSSATTTRSAFDCAALVVVLVVVCD